jgi:hypothetical protein
MKGFDGERKQFFLYKKITIKLRRVNASEGID